MDNDLTNELHEALNAWFAYTQDVPDGGSDRDRMVGVRLARYIGTLEAVLVAVTAEDRTMQMFALDRLRASLKAFE